MTSKFFGNKHTDKKKKNTKITNLYENRTNRKYNRGK